MANFFQKVLHFSLVLHECGEHFSIYYGEFGVFHKNSAENLKFCSPHPLFYSPILRKKQKKFATQTEKVVDVENSRCFTPTESPLAIVATGIHVPGYPQAFHPEVLPGIRPFFPFESVRPLTEEADSAACLAWKDVGR